MKPENLLFDTKGFAHLTDFGLVKKLEKSEKARTFCGTSEYMAPETILNKGVTQTVDWWSLGILLYELLYNKLPFYDDDI